MAKTRTDMEICLSKIASSTPPILDEAEDEAGRYDVRTEMKCVIRSAERISCPSCATIDIDLPDVRQQLEASCFIMVSVSSRLMLCLFYCIDIWDNRHFEKMPW